MRSLGEILRDARAGDGRASEELAVQLYAELRRLASREMAHERGEHTLQPTALAHEAYLRLVGDDDPDFENRAHFLGAAARAIRRILVDHARGKDRLKRGAGFERVELEDVQYAPQAPSEYLVCLDDALEELARLDPFKAQLVELRFFAGMSQEESARALGVSPSKVVRHWRMARAWLQERLERRMGKGGEARDDH